MSTAWERRAGGIIANYSAAMGALDTTITTSDAASVVFSDFATVLRAVRDENGNPVLQETAEGMSPQTALVWEGPANLTKTATPGFVAEAGGREDIADWQAETPLDYNPEPGDLMLISGFLHYVKGSDEGLTNTSFLTVYLLRKGRDNEGF